MELSDVMTEKYAAEDYLAKKRRDNAARCNAETERITRRRSDPDYVRAVKEQAERCMKNLYILPGTGGKLFDVGDPPAWSERRSYDEEYTWSLNRMPGFAPLTEAYLLTGDRRYADKAVSDLTDWIDKCPCPPLDRTDIEYVRKNFAAVTPWRSLEVGIRVFGSWKTLYIRLLETEIMTPELHDKFLRSIYEHAKCLRIMSPMLWPRADHNHYLHEMLGLLTIALMFPEFKEADAWREFSVHELERCANFQLTPEGGQVEGCPGYHNTCLSMFLDCLAIGEEYGIKFSDGFTSLVDRAVAYSAWTIKPTGLMAAIGDTKISDGDVPVLTESYYRIFKDYGEYSHTLPLLPPVAWSEVPQSVREAAEAKAASESGGSNYQETLGQYIYRTGWTRKDSYFIFVCNTPVNNGHTHQDPMTFELTLAGDDIVIDPSYYTYHNDDMRRRFKSPEYHSCLTFGGRPPFEYTGSWSYTPQKYGHTENTYSGDGFAAADAIHRNYEPDIHIRLALMEGGDVFIVADDVRNETLSDVRLYFHMNDPEVALTGAHSAGSKRIRVLLPESCSAEVVPSTKSPHCDVEEPTSRLILTDSSPERDSVYLTLFTKRDDVNGARAIRTDDGILISYKKAGKCVKLLWKYGEYCKRI